MDWDATGMACGRCKIWLFPHIIPEEGSWGRLGQAGGGNGVFLILLALSWWAQAVSSGHPDADSDSAVKDVTWMLETVKVELGMHAASKRGAEEDLTSASPAKK